MNGTNMLPVPSIRNTVAKILKNIEIGFIMFPHSILSDTYHITPAAISSKDALQK